MCARLPVARKFVRVLAETIEFGATADAGKVLIALQGLPALLDAARASECRPVLRRPARRRRGGPDGWRRQVFTEGRPPGTVDRAGTRSACCRSSMPGSNAGTCSRPRRRGGPTPGETPRGRRVAGQARHPARVARSARGLGRAAAGVRGRAGRRVAAHGRPGRGRRGHRRRRRPAARRRAESGLRAGHAGRAPGTLPADDAADRHRGADHGGDGAGVPGHVAAYTHVSGGGARVGRPARDARRGADRARAQRRLEPGDLGGRAGA